jgi:hypothetical protein
MRSLEGVVLGPATLSPRWLSSIGPEELFYRDSLEQSGLSCAVIGIQELVPAKGNFDIDAAQWDLYAEEVLVQLDDDTLGEDKIYYAAPGAFLPVMNNATLRGALRWLKHGPSSHSCRKGGHLT